MRKLLVLAVAAACGGPTVPAAPPPPPTRPVTALAELAGTWSATDADGWTYRMELGAETFAQTIERTRGGACAQRGRLHTFESAWGSPYDPAQFGAKPGSDAGTFALVITLEENACNPDFTGAQLIGFASEFTGDEVTLRLMAGWGGAQETRRYAKVP